MRFLLWRVRFTSIMYPRKIFGIKELWSYWCFDCYDYDNTQTPLEAANELTYWARK